MTGVFLILNYKSAFLSGKDYEITKFYTIAEQKKRIPSLLYKLGNSLTESPL